MKCVVVMIALVYLSTMHLIQQIELFTIDFHPKTIPPVDLGTETNFKFGKPKDDKNLLHFWKEFILSSYMKITVGL